MVWKKLPVILLSAVLGIIFVVSRYVFTARDVRTLLPQPVLFNTSDTIAPQGSNFTYKKKLKGNGLSSASKPADYMTAKHRLEAMVEGVSCKKPSNPWNKGFPTLRVNNIKNNLPPSVIEGVRRFVLFVGHGRSGTSILDAILVAHPHMIISWQYYLLQRILTSPRVFDHRDTIMNALTGRQKSMEHNWQTNTVKGYSLHVNGSYMGTYQDRVEVIGDESAGANSDLFIVAPDQFTTAYKKLQKMLGIPIKVIQIIRNPFDTIATNYAYLQGGAKLKLQLNAAAPLATGPTFPCDMNLYFDRMEAIDHMVQLLHLDLHRLHLSDLIARPSEEIQKLCTFLGLHCSADYLRVCKEAIFKESSPSRHKVQWSQDQISTVQKLAQGFSFLNRYSFDSD